MKRTRTNLFLALVLGLGLVAPVYAVDPVRHPVAAACEDAYLKMRIGAYQARRGAKLVWKRLLEELKKMAQSKSGKGSGQQAGPQDRRPPPSNSYQAHNKDLPGPDGTPPTPVVRFDGPPVTLFLENVFVDLDPDTATLSRPEAPYRKWDPGIVSGETGTLVRLQKSDNFPIPVGWLPLGGQEVASDGHGRFRSDAEEIVMSRAVKEPKTERELAKYRRIRRIPIQVFPDWVQAGVRELKALRESKLATDSVVAHKLQHLIQVNMKYAEEKTPHVGLVDVAHAGKCQCDLAASLWVYLMRAEFGIAARYGEGSQAHSNPKHGPGSFLLSSSIGHAWGQYYEQALQNWVDVDPTPPSDKDPAKQDKGDWQAISQETQNAHKEKKDGDKEKEGADKDKGHKGEDRERSDPRPPGLRDRSPEEIHAEATLRAAWAQALTNVSRNPGRAVELLRDFKQTAVALSAAPSGIAFEDKADALVKASSRELEDAHSLAEVAMHLRTTSEGNPLPHAPTLDLIQASLEELASIRSLHANERTALDKLRRVFGQRGVSPDLGQVEKAKAFFDSLPGPLSRRYVEDHLGVNLLDPSAMAKLAGALQNKGELEGLRRMLLIQPYLRLATVSDKKRGIVVFEDPTGELRSDLPWDLDKSAPGTPLDAIRSEGLPPRIEQLLALAGEMKQYGPQRFDENMATARYLPATTEYLVFDLSGSMGYNDRITMVNSLLAGLLDLARRNGAKKTVLIPYEGSPHTPIVLEPAGYYDMFLQLLKNKFRAGTTNDTGAALKFTAQLASAEHASNRINVRLITDGEEEFDLAGTVSAFSGLASKKTVNLSLISLVSGNGKMLSLATQMGQRISDSSNHVVHQHISREEIARIMKAARQGIPELEPRKTAIVSSERFELASAVQGLQQAPGVRSAAPIPADDPPPAGVAAEDWAQVRALRDQILKSWEVPKPQPEMCATTSPETCSVTR